MKKTFLFFLFLSFIFIKTNGQSSNISGKWQGTVTVEEKNYTMIYEFQKTDKGIYSGTLTDMNSTVTNEQLPGGAQEMAVSLPFDSIAIRKDSVFAFINIGGAVPCVYKGLLQSDSVMKGKWYVPTGSYPLDLKLMPKATTVFSPASHRPAENMVACNDMNFAGLLPEKKFKKYN